jgi:hypothetical protein
MGGFGSGRQYGGPVAEHCLRVDLTWMLRQGLALPNSCHSGILRWTCGDQPSGSISYQANMENPEDAWLILTDTRGSGSDKEDVRQEVRLTFTKPHYGGRRWWMICPYRGNRVAILYKPGNGDRFASRKAWRVAYKSQRVSQRDKPFEALFRLQRKLGGFEGWEAGLNPRPKGMWYRTYQRMWDEYDRLDAHCAYEMAVMLQILKSSR